MTLQLSLRNSEIRAALLARLEAEAERRIRENSLLHYRPYAKQQEFHTLGATKRERLFIAGNQLGKTIAGGFEAAAHATLRYPDGWAGKRFDCPTFGWAAGVTGEGTRDNVQRILLGREGRFGEGAIPKECIDDVITARGVPGLVDTIIVRNELKSVSTIGLKSYEKGREKWQGETLHWVWFDEEPPLDIYTEGLTRTNATRGITWMTFTPLLGMSEVVQRFLLEENPDRAVVTMTIDDVEHYDAADKARIIASYPAHEREARARGVPALGSGRIFPVTEESITIEAFPIPRHWALIGALDFGWDHPTAAVRLAWDRDADIVYVTNCYRESEKTPLHHSAALKPWGKSLQWAWPHDGLQHDKGSGVQLAQQYREHGLILLPERAQFDDGSNGVEAGLFMMLERMETGRFKVFSHLAPWFDEFRLYHRKDGKVVKIRDDLMSATRYATMSLRFASPERNETLEKPTRKWVV